MIVSNDSIMKPPYYINENIIRLISAISVKLGEINILHLDKPSAVLRKQNQIRTIHASLQIEGNTLTESQITALLENKRIVGPKKDIIEVQNAINVYQALSKFDPYSEKSLLKAHQCLLEGLLDHSGSYRKQNVGIVKGKKIEHFAPGFDKVIYLMKDLFTYLKKDTEISLIKSCVFHYELEFIHPFIDGNGRMGRLWQTLILMKEYPIFEFIPFETIIKNRQDAYYLALSTSDKIGNSTPFIEFMLAVLLEALNELSITPQIKTEVDRLHYFIEKQIKPFSRKDYISVFKELSTATASRDLAKGVELGVLIKSGDKNKTLYFINESHN